MSTAFEVDNSLNENNIASPFSSANSRCRCEFTTSPLNSVLESNPSMNLRSVPISSRRLPIAIRQADGVLVEDTRVWSDLSGA